MDFLTYGMHLLASGAIAYYSAVQIRDLKTRPNVLAGFQLAESGSVPFLTALSERAADEGDTWLAEKLAKHASDENRHGQIFAHSLKHLNKKVKDFENTANNTAKNIPKERQETKSERSRSPFFAAYFQGYSSEEFKPAHIDWNVFMGSTYILELDASKDFARMANVLPETDANTRSLKQGMLSIAKDETTHAAYLYEAMMRRMSATEAQALVDEWRKRKVNAMWAFASNLLQREQKPPSLVQDGAPSEANTELVTA